jgi:hypothetical protein
MQRQVYETMIEAAKRQMISDMLNRLGMGVCHKFKKPVQIFFLEGEVCAKELCHSVMADSDGELRFEVSTEVSGKETEWVIGDSLLNYLGESLIDVWATLDKELSEPKASALSGLAESKLEEQVTVICYNDTEVMTRRAAMEKYFDCMRNSEGPEHRRYETVFFQLLTGRMTADDQIPFYEI